MDSTAPPRPPSPTSLPNPHPVHPVGPDARPGSPYVAKTSRPSVVAFKISFAFQALFYALYFSGTALRVLALDVADPIGAAWDGLLGLGIAALFVASFMAARARFGAFMTVVGFALWWTLPCNWIISDWEAMRLDFAGTYYAMWTVLVALAAVALLGLVNLVAETARLRRAGRSIFWGPWFARVSDVVRFKQLPPAYKRRAYRGLLVGTVALGLAIPGLLPQVVPSIYPAEISITPRPYQARFNFWATADVTQYNASVRAELNEHQVNMDVMWNRVTPETVAALVEWEATFPNTTYRVVLTPRRSLSTLAPIVFEATEILLACEANGTLDQWRGFCFDIEGDRFGYSSAAFTSFEEAVGMWQTIFDYVDARSAERGRPIEMECVSVPGPAMDVPFDGDSDMQRDRRYPCFTPERWTLYAPMVYRCWYQGTRPFGHPADSTRDWSTSYEIYSTLQMLYQNLPAEKVGIYLGITNCSCYGRDLPQPEPVTWGPATGFGNLLRDVLVCKHFGVEEITFFLPWTVYENNYSMGGTFEAYGIDFLDVVNQTVNTAPPERFSIFYNHADAMNTEKLRYDWVYDFSRPGGFLELVGLVLVATVVVFVPPWLQRRRSGGQCLGVEHAGRQGKNKPPPEPKES